VPNETSPGLEQPLLETRERRVPDGVGQHQPPQQVAEVIGDDAEEQPHLVGPEPMTGEPGPVSRRLAFLDPLLRRPALVVEADDGPVRPVKVVTMKPTREAAMGSVIQTMSTSKVRRVDFGDCGPPI